MIANDKFYLDNLTRIYNDVYKKLNHQYVDVFLCGGASTNGSISIRDQIKEKMNKFKDIRILYPEDLFIEMLKDKEYNLLDLESFLAENSDVICIVCESAGSLVELGAFTNNKKTVGKVIALIEKRRKRQKSFIMLGPIKVLKSISKEKVLYYNSEEVEKTTEKLQKLFNKKRRSGILDHKSLNNKSIDTLIGMYYFIPLLLYFHKHISSTKIIILLQLLLQREGYKVNNFDRLFRPSLKLLYKDKYIIKNIKNGESAYSLTEKGHDEMSRLLGGLRIENKDFLFDSIRFDIMRSKYYNGK